MFKNNCCCEMTIVNLFFLLGRAMKIEIVAEPSATSRPRPAFSQRRSGQGRGRGNRGRGRGGFRRNRGGGSGRRNPTKTAEELDAELDAYHDQVLC